MIRSTGTAATLLLTVSIAGCSRDTGHAEAAHASAPDLMIQYGCPTCHVIPRVPGAVGKVGPSLDDLAQRSFLAGTLQNSPDNLVRWIRHPQQFQPGTAMPEMGVTAEDAKSIVAFLETNH
jgi:cytochrome c2